MATNYIQDGDVLMHTAGAALTSGTPVVIGTIVGIPITDIANGETGAVRVAGVFELPLKSGDTPAQGAKMYWHVANAEVTTTATGATLCGVCAEANSGKVLLNVGL